jgi:2-iminobutanoate/2-iminopropanoate deaminase
VEGLFYDYFTQILRTFWRFRRLLGYRQPQAAPIKEQTMHSLEEITRRALSAPEAMCEAYDYQKPVAFSRGMEVMAPGARMIFVSGTAAVGEDGKSLFPGDFRRQARRAFENARSVLAAGRADWKDVVKVTIYLRDIGRDYAALNAVRNAYFAEMGIEVFPASTCVEARLCRDDLLVEMDMIAVAE